MDPIDETKLDQLAETLQKSKSIKFSEDKMINATILHDKDRIKKFLKGEKIPLTNLQSVTQFLTSHGDYKALIAVCDLSSLNLRLISDSVIRGWNDSLNTPAICMNKKIDRLIKQNLDSVERFIRLDESLIRLIRLADELVDATEITDAHKEQARAIISLRDRIALNRNPTENDAIYASAESLIHFLKTEEPE